jgi:Flp pilus assembly protein TadG
MIEKLIGSLRLAVRSFQDSGAAAVEFAITAPLLVVLAFGAADYGALMTNAASLEGATRAAAEYVRNDSHCVAGGLLNSACITGINNLVSTLKSSATSLSSAGFTLPGGVCGSPGTVTASMTCSLPTNFCTCADNSVPTGAGITNGCPGSGVTNPCASITNPATGATDPRILRYIEVQATLTVNPLISYGTYTSGKSVNAQTTTRIQ